ncbi:MAG: MASE1 domain-containing protein [Betaproteobacteria bacterium]|nr:MASE1 domain-containing protein [Betaproteobacteria bacterium]
MAFAPQTPPLPASAFAGSNRQNLAIAIAAGVLYWLLSEASILIAARQPPFPVWLSEGFALGLWFIAPKSSRWLQLVAVFAANMLSTLQAGMPGLSNATAGSAVNVFQLAAGGWALERAQIQFQKSGNTLTLFVALLAGPVGVVNVVCAYLSALVFHYRNGIDVGGAFTTLFVSDGLGVLLMTPLLVTWADRVGRMELIDHPRLKLEAAAVFSLVAAISYWVFSMRPDPFGLVPPVFYLGIPFVLWAAIRFSLRGATLALALHALIAFYFTLRDLGPFSAGFIPSSQSVLQLQGYLAVLIITTLLASVLMRERRTASKNALSWRMRYEAALQVSANVVYEIRSNSQRVVWAGDTMAALGIPHEAISTTSAWTAHIHPDDRAMMIGLRKKLLSGVLPNVELNCRLRREDDTYITVGITAYGANAPDVNFDLGEAEGRRIIGFVKDITEKVRAQEERQRLESELRHAQKMEAIGQLAGGIAHDFNNILASIIGYAELAKSRATGDETLQRQLATVLRAGERGRILVSQVLTFSRKSPEQRIGLNLDDVIDEVVQLARGSNPHEIRFAATPPGKHMVAGNPTELHQLFMNIVTNGMQAMPEGGVLDISIEPADISSPIDAILGRLEPGKYLQVRVHDEGAGINPEIQQRMFEPFFTTKAVGQGTGLGLSLALSIAKSHCGAIAVESIPGKGATFTIYLPVFESASIPHEIELPRGHDERILLVDDETPLRALAEELLVDLGYQVASFGESTEALAAIERNPAAFDAILSDEVMPGLTGTQLAARVREIRPDLPIVIITGYGGPGFELRAQQAGVIRVMRKPYRKDELARALASVFIRPSQ